MTEFGFDLPDIEGEEVEVIEDEFEEELLQNLFPN